MANASVFPKQEKTFFKLDGSSVWFILHKMCNPKNDYLTRISGDAFKLYIFLLAEHNHKVHDGDFSRPLKMSEKKIMDRFKIADRRTLKKYLNELIKAPLIKAKIAYFVIEDSYFYLESIFRPTTQSGTENPRVDPYDESNPVPF